jgi:hypothetical protein
MAIPAMIDQNHELILEYRRFSVQSITGQLGISRERVGSIIIEDLDRRKLSAKWALKCPSDEKNFNGASHLSNGSIFSA